MADIARIVKPEPAGFAIDGRPESPRPYPPGQDPHGAKDAAKHGGDLAH